MFIVTRRVSFTVALALTIGWGIFFLFFLASSSALFDAQQSASEHVVVLPPGVRLSVQLDKRVYRGGETVLIAVRNDSRLPIWLPYAGDTCPSAWWSLERLGEDGETWTHVATTKQACTPTDVVQFTNHSLKTDAWMALVPGPQIGEVLVNPETGTYRLSVPYIKGKKNTTMKLEHWMAEPHDSTTSGTFTIQ
jgi:hypothetical protein